MYLNAANGITFAMTPPSQVGGSWGFAPLHTLYDYSSWQTPGPDYDVHNPQSPPVVSSKGDVISQTALGGADGGSDYTIAGGVISVNPSTGADTIVSNDFTVSYHNTRGGPSESYNNPMTIHLDAKNRVCCGHLTGLNDGVNGEGYAYLFVAPR